MVMLNSRRMQPHMPQTAKLSKQSSKVAIDAKSGYRAAEEVVKGLSFARPLSFIEWHWIRAKQAIFTLLPAHGPKFLIADL
jgi:hypothetical protein